MSGARIENPVSGTRRIAAEAHSADRRKCSPRNTFPIRAIGHLASVGSLSALSVPPGRCRTSAPGVGGSVTRTCVRAPRHF
jgi:hypothetical protein